MESASKMRQKDTMSTAESQSILMMSLTRPTSSSLTTPTSLHSTCGAPLTMTSTIHVTMHTSVIYPTPTRSWIHSQMRRCPPIVMTTGQTTTTSMKWRMIQPSIHGGRPPCLRLQDSIDEHRAEEERSQWRKPFAIR